MNTVNIDENLYSRQLYVLGKDAMNNMANSDVLISGINGLGLEIAKNVALCGVRSITLHDTKNISMSDLQTNYYANIKHIGKNRADVSAKKLSELNMYVKINTYTDKLDNEYLKNFKVIVIIDMSYQEQIPINEFARNNNIHYISASTPGLFGQVFCDFGNNFICYDNNGEDPSISYVENIIKNDDNTLTIKCNENHPHNLETGDHIMINTDPIQIEKIDGFIFKIKDCYSGNYISGEIIKQVKIPFQIKFKSLKESIENPEFVEIDCINMDMPKKIHELFKSFGTSNATIEYFKNIFGDIVNENFMNMLKYQLTPIQSVIGGIVAQEVLKACSGKFNPIKQWLYFDALTCFDNTITDTEPIGYRYDNHLQIFGRKFVEKVLKQKYFIVGAGAIGCELLKNFAMIGIGNIIITDMDIIEKSNLSRQFLFRNSDIGKFKSLAAANAVKEMNNDINIISHTNKVGQETESIYDDEFYKSLNGIANALDNVESRKYMDQQCVKYGKPLLESGTQGTKGNTQIVIPHLTETYSSQPDQQEKTYPVCTLKHFPYEIHHTIQWARDEFEGLFTRAPENTRKYLINQNFMENMNDNDKYEIICDIKSILINDYPTNFEDCIGWAIKHWYKQYNYDIKQLLEQHPKDSMHDGVLFWSGTKHCPHILDFDINNNEHMNYVIFTANLRAQIYDLKINNTNIKNIITNYLSKNIYELQNMKYDKQETYDNARIQSEFEKIYSLIIDNIQNYKINSIKFEKDDETNYHIDFITSSSNMRAMNYNIEIADKYTTKKIAGKIIPAIMTTTSIVAGLVTLELYKLLQDQTNISKYRNYYFNLALPLFSQSEPEEIHGIKVGNKLFTIWDKIIIEKDITLNEFLEYFKTKYDIGIMGIIYKQLMLYSLSLSSIKKKNRMNKKITEIIYDITGEKIMDKSIILNIVPISDKEINFPDIIYFIE